MKRKILFAIILSIVFIMTFALCAFAVDYNEKATLADGTVLPIYDENQNPLIWWVSGEENGKNVYSSVPNNRKEPNANNDTYVTYTNGNGNQLRDITFYIYDEASGTYIPYTDKDLKLVVVNLRGLTGFVYLHQNFNFKNIQCIYFHEELLDCCKFFAGSTDLRLVDLTVCTKMTGGFGGVRNFYNCSNLHTIRFAPTASYSLKCSQNYNWRFSGTAVVSFVFPENITNLGIDNFKDNSKLESIYILGNNTSLGQRNFLNCPNLTNIYILGDDPQITTTEFAENFYSCVDGNKVLDFSNTGKYFFFATENSEYLENMRAAIEATAVVPYSSYKANPQNYTEGRYIISGTNTCEALGNKHSFDPTQTNSCTGFCVNCGDAVMLENAAHNFITTVEYTAYSVAGKKIQVCQNDNCEYKTKPLNTSVAPIISNVKGFSTRLDGDGLTFGYSIDYGALDSYTKQTGKTVEIGLVVAIKSVIGGNDPLNSDASILNDSVLKANIVTWTDNDEENATKSKYARIDLILVGNWNEIYDLDGDKTAETSAKDMEFVIAGYVYNGETLSYINEDASYQSANTITYNDCI